MDHLFSRPQAGRRQLTGDRLVVSEPISRGGAFQNGNFNSGLDNGSDVMKRLGFLNRSQRHILSYSGRQTVPEISVLWSTACCTSYWHRATWCQICNFRLNIFIKGTAQRQSDSEIRMCLDWVLLLTAPLVFTNVMSEVAAYAHLNGIPLHIYLDD